MPASTSPPRRRRAWPIVATAVATFLVVLALLAYQLRTGRDPALGRTAVTAVGATNAHGRSLVSRTSGASATPVGQVAHSGAVAPLLSSHTSGARAEDD